MPRHSKGNRSSQKNITTIHGNYLLSQTVAGTSASSLLINPSIFPRANTISATFENYRFTHIQLSMIPANIVGGVNDLWALGFSSDVGSVNSIITAAEVTECIPSGVQTISGSATVATAPDLRTGHFSLARANLITDTSLKWFKCTGDSGTNQWENIQGMLIYYNPFATSQIFTVFVRYKLEFSSPISTLLTAPCLRTKVCADSQTNVSTCSSSFEVEFVPHPSDCSCRYCYPRKSIKTKNLIDKS